MLNCHCRSIQMNYRMTISTKWDKVSDWVNLSNISLNSEISSGFILFLNAGLEITSSYSDSSSIQIEKIKRWSSNNNSNFFLELALIQALMSQFTSNITLMSLFFAIPLVANSFKTKHQFIIKSH